MNIKYLMMTSFISLISASVVQAADIIAHRETTAPVVAAPAVTVSEFPWAGFYLGGQAGHFTSKVEIRGLNKKAGLLSKDKTPHPSGFMGGIYAGSNIALGNNVILGVETDAVWAGREDKKTVLSGTLDNDGANDFKELLEKSGIKLEENDKPASGDMVSGDFAYKEKWSGATRARVGFVAVNYIMPYLAGGVAYAQMEGTSTHTGTKRQVEAGAGKVVSAKVFSDKTTMVGYTVGGGVDFAMTDNVLLRAEYRYSDFGKKKFKKDDAEFKYKTNDFRVGIAYKF